MSLFKRYHIFLIVGGLSYGVNLGLTYFLTDIVGFWYMISVIAGTLASWTVMFALNLKFTFNLHQVDSVKGAYLKNMAMYVILAPVGWGLVYLLTSIIGIYYLLSQMAVVFGMSIISYLFGHYYIFKQKNESSNPSSGEGGSNETFDRQ